MIVFFLRRPTPPSPEPVEGLETAAEEAGYETVQAYCEAQSNFGDGGNGNSGDNKPRGKSDS